MIESFHEYFDKAIIEVNEDKGAQSNMSPPSVQLLDNNSHPYKDLRKNSQKSPSRNRGELEPVDEEHEFLEDTESIKKTDKIGKSHEGLRATTQVLRHNHNLSPQ